LPLTPSTYALTKLWLVAHRGASDHLFYGFSKGGIFATDSTTPNTVARICRDRTSSALSRKISFKDFRSGFKTELMAANMEPGMVEYAMGMVPANGRVMSKNEIAECQSLILKSGLNSLIDISLRGQVI